MWRQVIWQTGGFQAAFEHPPNVDVAKWFGRQLAGAASDGAEEDCVLRLGLPIEAVAVGEQ